MYLALALGLAAEASRLDLRGWALEVVILGLPLAGALAWVVEQAGARVPKAVRVISGACIGFGVGWVIGVHLRSPWPEELVKLSLGLGVALLLGVAARWLSGTDYGNNIVFGPYTAIDDGQRVTTDHVSPIKSASDPRNEVDPEAS